MRKRILKILICLLKYFSQGRIGIYHASKDTIMKKEEAFEKFVILIGIIEKFYNVRFDSLIKRTRKREIREKRQMLEALAYKYTGLSSVQIGGMTKRDHATVLHSIKQIDNLRETEKEVALQYNALCEKIKNNFYN